MRIVMMGTGTFAEPALEALLRSTDSVVGVFTQPDRFTGTARGSTRQVGRGMGEIAREKEIPVFQPENVNSPEGLEMLRSLQPELLVVAAYGQILSAALLGLPSIGAINIHASLLPKYRGAAPIAHAILAGETETGVTIIRITPGLDAGEMLKKGSVTIGEDETSGELEARLAPIGAALALEVIEEIRAGKFSGERQEKSQVTKAPKLKKEDGLLNFRESPEALNRRIRAMQPWPTAYSFLHRENGEVLRVLILKTAFSEVVGTLPGEVVPMPGQLLISCGEAKTLRVLELQPSGKRRMAAEEFLRGRPLTAKDRFGPEVATQPQG